MITEIDAGRIVYKLLSFMGMERRLKGHLKTSSLDGESPMVGETVPSDGMIVILPKTMSADKTYFNGCVIEVNVLMRDINGETNPDLNDKLREILVELGNGVVSESDGTWYRVSIRSHGIEEESRMKCHFANITMYFETLNVR